MTENKNIVLFLGCSGVGKSSLIRALCTQFYEVYEYVKPYTTRDIRMGENDKSHISREVFLSLVKKRVIICPNDIDSNLYGPSKRNIEDIIEKGLVPVLDWPVDKINQLRRELESFSLINIYILPPNREILKERLEKDKRDTRNERYRTALIELDMIKEKAYDDQIDIFFINEGELIENALKIHSMIPKINIHKDGNRRNG